MTIVKLVMSDESSSALNRHIESHGLQGRNSFHSTLLYTESIPVIDTHPLKLKCQEFLPVKLNPKTYSLDLFGEKNDVLALRYESQDLVKARGVLIFEALFKLSNDYLDPEIEGEQLSREEIEERIEIVNRHTRRRRTTPIYAFNPHITLCKDFPNSSRNFHVPKFPLTFDRIIFDQN